MQEQSTALVVHDGADPVDRARTWSTMPDDERRRRAVAAAHAREVATLQDLAEAWLVLHGKAGATVSAYTRRNYRHGVRTLVEAWREENLLHPRRAAAALWLRQLEAAGLKPATVQIRLSAARSLYSALRWAAATDADPFETVRPAPDKTPRWEKRHPYRPEEIEALLRVADHEERVLILLAAHAGLRVSECLALRRADVSPARRELVVQAGKGRRRRTVPLSASLVTALQAAQARDDADPLYVLPYRSAFPARQRLKRLARAAGVPYRGVHAFRHACGTRLVKQMNGDLEAAARLLGHSSIETTRVYVKWSDDRLRETVGAW